MSELTGWIAVDLDGTLADYSEWKGPEHIGAPVPLMVERVKVWRAQGRDIRIFTARVARDEDGSVLAVIDKWCEEHLGERLPVTNTKDYGMVELWDDRCVQVIPNTGERADGIDLPFPDDAPPLPEIRPEDVIDLRSKISIARSSHRGLVIGKGQAARILSVLEAVSARKGGGK